VSGIRTNQWIASLLTDRTQRDIVAGQTSPRARYTKPVSAATGVLFASRINQFAIN